MQRLSATHHGRHRLHCRAHDVIVRLLRRERPARRLAVRAKHQRALVLRVEVLLHKLCPQRPRRAKFGHLHVEVHRDAPKEGDAWRDVVDADGAGCDRRTHVLKAVRQREGELELRVCPGLLHVIARDGDRVELGHAPRRVSHDVGDDAHRRQRRVDEGVAHHELFQDVVLNRATQLRLVDALLLGGDDVHGNHRQHGAVHWGIHTEQAGV